MAGLIWLWQNIGGTTPPAVVVDYGVSPQLSFVLSSQPYAVLEDPLANILSVDTTSSVLTITTTTYNESSVSYNSNSQVYGGVGRSKDPAPQFYKVGNK